MRRPSRPLLVVLGTIGGVVVLVAIGLVNLHWFRGPIERAIGSATGREAHLRGELRVWPLIPPRLNVGDVSLSNAPWARQPQMFTARHLSITPFFWRTLRGQIAFRSIDADGVDLDLETNAQNAGNWEFDNGKPKPDKGDAGPPDIEIRKLVLRDSRVAVSEQAFKTKIDVEARTEAGGADGVNRLRVTGHGTYRDGPFHLDGRFDVPERIDAESLVVDTHLEATAGATHLTVSGRLPAAITTRGATVDFSMEGDDLSSLYPLLGIALPPTAPYGLGGQLTWHGRRVDWKGLDGRIGDSALRGDASLDLAGPRPKIAAQLTSPRLDIDDLGALLGIPPSVGDGETASPEQKKTKAELASRGRVLPDKPLDFGKLHALDADVSLTAEHINAPKLPLQRLKAHVTLKDGKLTADPFDFDAASGKLASKIVLDASHDPLAYALSMDIRDMKLAELVPKSKMMKEAKGAIRGDLRLQGHGNSVAAMFADADGQLRAIMSGGQVPNLLLELASLDVAHSVKYLLGKDPRVPIRCAYFDFRVVDGVAGADAFALDTDDTALLGKGSIDLRDEHFDLSLFPKPKHKSFLALRSPLKIGGSFLDPSFAPQAGPLVLRGAAAAALAAIAPPAALLAMIETGPGHDIACGPGQREGTEDATGREDEGRPAGKPRPERPPPGPRPPDKV